MATKQDSALVKRIIKLYGPVLDLRTNPGVIIDILRRFDEPPDGGTPCGGVPTPPAPEPPAPSPSPSPSRVGDLITNEDLMRAVLKLTREVSALRKSLPAPRKRRR